VVEVKNLRRGNSIFGVLLISFVGFGLLIPSQEIGWEARLCIVSTGTKNLVPSSLVHYAVAAEAI